MKLNFDFGGDSGKYMVELVNGVLNHTAGVHAKDAAATITLKRAALDKIMLKELKLKDAVAAGDVKVSGDEGKLDQLVSYLDTFEFWFNLVTP